jgi:hypothetical protein
MRPGLPWRLAILLALWGPAAPAGADPVGIGDLRLLVEGGVGESAILRHLERWGLERDLAAADLVALRQAGAAESLLEALAGARGIGTPGERSVPLAGGRGLLLTNLDDEGRRLGGEVGREEELAEPEPAPLAEEAWRDPIEFLPRGEDPGDPMGWRRVTGQHWSREDRPRIGTPGGYTRYKLYYSSRPDDGFRTWVLPTHWHVQPMAPFLPPAILTYFPPYLVF